MASLPCPNVEQCGGTIRFGQHHEYDVNAHWVDICDQDCTCELTADQVETLCDQAAQLPMAEPQSMSRADVLVSLRDYALVLRECDRAMAWQVADRLDAIAAAVASWCVVEGGHRYQLAGEHWCLNCGQRRAEEA